MIARLLKWFYCRYAPQAIKNAIALTLSDVERFKWPAVTTPPAGKSVVVLAPHPDDESIGCGGALVQYRRQNVPVHIIVMTDGELGDREVRLCQDASKREELQKLLVKTRRSEAKAATSILNANSLHFLEAPDGGLNPTDQSLLRRLGNKLLELRPDIIFLPFMTDRHRDHWATNACLMALRQSDSFAWLDQTTCCGYEVWSPLYTNALIDITGEMPVKLKAIAEYRSQIKDVDYARGVEGLNRYRGIAGLLPRDCYAEAYYIAPFPAYRNLFQQQNIT